MSYGREETAYLTGWLYDWLAGRYGRRPGVQDVDSIQLDEDFVGQRQRASSEGGEGLEPGIFLFVSLAIYTVDVRSLMPQ